MNNKIKKKNYNSKNEQDKWYRMKMIAVNRSKFRTERGLTY